MTEIPLPESVSNKNSLLETENVALNPNLVAYVGEAAEAMQKMPRVARENVEIGLAGQWPRELGETILGEKFNIADSSGVITNEANGEGEESFVAGLRIVNGAWHKLLEREGINGSAFRDNPFKVARQLLQAMPVGIYVGVQNACLGLVGFEVGLTPTQVNAFKQENESGKIIYWAAILTVLTGAAALSYLGWKKQNNQGFSHSEERKKIKEAMGGNNDIENTGITKKIKEETAGVKKTLVSIMPQESTRRQALMILGILGIIGYIGINNWDNIRSRLKKAAGIATGNPFPEPTPSLVSENEAMERLMQNVKDNMEQGIMMPRLCDLYNYDLRQLTNWNPKWFLVPSSNGASTLTNYLNKTVSVSDINRYRESDDSFLDFIDSLDWNERVKMFYRARVVLGPDDFLLWVDKYIGNDRFVKPELPQTIEPIGLIPRDNLDVVLNRRSFLFGKWS